MYMAIWATSELYLGSGLGVTEKWELLISFQARCGQIQWSYSCFPGFSVPFVLVPVMMNGGKFLSKSINRQRVL